MWAFFAIVVYAFQYSKDHDDYVRNLRKKLTPGYHHLKFKKTENGYSV